MNKIKIRKTRLFRFCYTAFRLTVCFSFFILFSCIQKNPVVSNTKADIPKISESVNIELNNHQIPINANPKLVQLNVEHGLSQSTVFSIVQDNLGYIWFGTEEGLNRYDGYNFHVYRNDPEDNSSISHHWINKIIVDHTGVMWLATDGGGINRYNNKTDSFTRYMNDTKDSMSLINDEVTSILEDSEGELWFGTRGGLSKFDRERKDFQNFKNEGNLTGSLHENEILTLYEDSVGDLWIGTDGAGISRFNKTTKTFVNYPINTTDGTDRYRTVQSLVEDTQGRLLIGSHDGLLIFDPRSEQFSVVPAAFNPFESLNRADIYSIYEDHDGLLWVGTWGDGLYVIEPERGVLHNYRENPGDPGSLSKNMVISFYQDREGILWIGTATGGINKLSLDNRAFAYFKHDPNNQNSLSDDWVRSIDEDELGVLWITTGDGGLNSYNRETDTWTNFINDPNNLQSISSNFLSHTLLDSDGNFWIATENGVDRFNEADKTFTHFRDDMDSTTNYVDANRIRHIFEDSKGQLWIATSGYGIAKFDPDTGEFTRYRHNPENPNSLIHDTVWHIDEDSEGYLWVSTTGGLSRFDPKTETFSQHLVDPDNPSTTINQIAGNVTEDSSGRLWVGTYGGGLNEIIRDSDTYRTWNQDTGLPNDVIYATAVDKQGLLWLSTNNGLSRFDPESETFTNFQLKDGQPIVEFNANSMGSRKSGELLFGGINGFISFDPAFVTKNQYVPPIVFTTINREYSNAQSEGNIQEIIIKWPENSIEFEFAALSFSNSKFNQYAYMLEGLDKTWVETGTSRTGRYDRLPGGIYTLRVIGSNDDGLWNNEGAAIRITVIPPFWKTLLFRLFLIVIVLVAAFGVYILRVRSIKEHNRNLESEVEERTIALKQEAMQRLKAEEMLHQARMESVITEERGRLARDLHDSVTQSLYSLTLFTEATREHAKSGKLDQVQYGLERSADTALQALKEMRLLVYELRPSALREDGLIGALRQRLDAVESRAGVKTKLIVDGSEDIQLPQDIEEAAFRISQEALNNALKHGHATEIIVRISQPTNSQYLELEVSDNGIGFELDDNNEKGGMGICNIKERAEGMGARLSIRSTLGKGTVISLYVGLKND